MFARTHTNVWFDRLLASSAYGERWGRHWLDLARYADSNGFTRDFGREIWKYREWVISAINANMPFDQFTIEQFAGDMLPNATLDQQIATGFHRNTLINEEGGTDKEQFRIDAVADRVATTGCCLSGADTRMCSLSTNTNSIPFPNVSTISSFLSSTTATSRKSMLLLQGQIELGVVSRRDAIRAQIADKEESLKQSEEEIAKQQSHWETAVTPEFYRTLPGPTQAALDAEPEKRNDDQQTLVRELYKTTDHARGRVSTRRPNRRLEIARTGDSPRPWYCVSESATRKTHIHRRGNFLDIADEVVSEVPAILHPLRTEARVNRLDLANWLCRPAQPTHTARRSESLLATFFWTRHC